MSLKIMNIGFSSNLKPTAKLIYIAIADFANDEGECFPSKSKIAEKASVSMSTLKYYIRAFENLRIIKTEQTYRKNGSKSSLLYKINIESENLEKSRIEKAYQKCRKSEKSHNVTIPKKGDKFDNKNLLKVTIQNANCDGLESSYYNHQSLDEEEVKKHFLDFYSYLESIGVKAKKSRTMHMNRIKNNLLKGHKVTMQNFNDYLLHQTAYKTAQEIDTIQIDSPYRSSHILQAKSCTKKEIEIENMKLEQLKDELNQQNNRLLELLKFEKPRHIGHDEQEEIASVVKKIEELENQLKRIKK